MKTLWNVETMRTNSNLSQSDSLNKWLHRFGAADGIVSIEDPPISIPAQKFHKYFVGISLSVMTIPAKGQMTHILGPDKKCQARNKWRLLCRPDVIILCSPSKWMADVCWNRSNWLNVSFLQAIAIIPMETKHIMRLWHFEKYCDFSLSIAISRLIELLSSLCHSTWNCLSDSQKPFFPAFFF